MRACLIDEANAAFGIPESYEVFAQKPDAFWLAVARQILGGQEGYPVETKELSKGRTLPDPHQPFIVFMREHELPPLKRIIWLSFPEERSLGRKARDP